MWLFKSFDKKRTQNLLKLSIERMTLLQNKKKAPPPPAHRPHKSNQSPPPASLSPDCPCSPASIRTTRSIHGEWADSL